ncbi:hypothetical protein Clacol_001474 [Clathrus columnatus]|uniref:Uncharacterized protein n=1 Tax=Clathrus columnatus TaxID=1419009 RepID=A0AAV4ZYB7_9AGAM|nr:hypothetical protein Clacol_001474 [Clathrus columnatus]
MNLARYSLTPTTPIQFIDARFDADNKIFSTSTLKGYAVYSAWPLKLLKKRELSNGTLSIVQLLHTTSLLFLVGGGRSPLYPPNKVIFWDDAQGKEIAELEFRERVRGLACRRGWLIVALRRRIVAFTFDSENGRPERWREWDTCDNPRGLIALASAPYSTLLVIPGLQTGHVHLIHLPPCWPTSQSSQTTSSNKRPIRAPTHNPKEIIIAHESALTTLTVPPSGRIFSTTSSKGTLIRIWDSHTGNLIRELRRGTDRAEIFGVAFKSDESEICVWSDKGTIHVFRLGNINEGGGNRQSALAPLSPFFKLHKYFESEWSYAHFRLPTPPTQIHLSNTTSVTAPKDELFEEERCVACWIEVPTPEPVTSTTVRGGGDNHSERSGSEVHSNRPQSQPPSSVEHQLIVVTYSGGWYRLALPSSSRPRSRSISTVGTSSSSSAAGTTTATRGTLRPSSSSVSPSVRELTDANRKTTTALESTSSKARNPIQSHKVESVRGSVVGSATSATTIRERGHKPKAWDSNEVSSSSEGGRRCTLVEFRKVGQWDDW